MKATLVSTLLAVGTMSRSVSALLAPYAECGGLTWQYEWQCGPGTTCSPVVTGAVFPNYQCYPDVGPITPHVFPWGQCGGASYVGPTLCPPYWTCVKNNEFFSTCVMDAGYVTPPNTTPGIASPGAFCGESAIARGYASVCASGYTCTGPGTYGYYVCLADPKVTTTSSVAPTTLATTTKSVTTSKTTTTKKTTTSKTTTTKKTSSVKATSTA